MNRQRKKWKMKHLKSVSSNIRLNTMGEREQSPNDKGKQSEKPKDGAKKQKMTLGDELLLQEFEWQERANKLIEEEKKEQQKSNQAK